MRPIACLALAVSLGLGLGGCSSEEPAATDDDAARSTIIQPGRPGESNRTLDPDTVVEEAETNESDLAFMQLMVPHHAQALEMSQLARTRAQHPQVVALARRIQGAQGPEIQAMTGWLQSRGVEVPESMADVDGGHGGHHGDDMAAMHGMLTGQQMAELARARGAEFDRLFLTGMIQHHRGAVAMAQTEMESGSDVLALELAGDIAAGQLAEIGRLQDVLRGL